MNATFALIAFLSLNPAQPGELSSFVIDTGMSETDCDTASEMPQFVILQDGVKLYITDTSVLSCEEEWK